MIRTVTKKKWKLQEEKGKRIRKRIRIKEKKGIISFDKVRQRARQSIHKLTISLIAVLSSRYLSFFLLFASSSFFFSFLFITLLDNQRLSSPAPKPRNTPSYTPNMIAALGTTRSTCGVRPPYMPAMPSTRQTVLKQSTRPV